LVVPSTSDDIGLVLTWWVDFHAVSWAHNDMEIIDRLSAGDPEKKKYYIRLFLDTIEPELGNLQAIDISVDQEPIRAILHKLKSQVQTIGAVDAHALMSAQEQTIKEGKQITQSELDNTCELLSVLIQNMQDLLK